MFNRNNAERSTVTKTLWPHDVFIIHIFTSVMAQAPDVNFSITSAVFALQNKTRGACKQSREYMARLY